MIFYMHVKEKEDGWKNKTTESKARSKRVIFTTTKKINERKKKQINKSQKCLIPTKHTHRYKEEKPSKIVTRQKNNNRRHIKNRTRFSQCEDWTKCHNKLHMQFVNAFNPKQTQNKSTK